MSVGLDYASVFARQAGGGATAAAAPFLPCGGRFVSYRRRRLGERKTTESKGELGRAASWAVRWGKEQVGRGERWAGRL